MLLRFCFTLRRCAINPMDAVIHGVLTYVILAFITLAGLAIGTAAASGRYWGRVGALVLIVCSVVALMRGWGGAIFPIATCAASWKGLSWTKKFGNGIPYLLAAGLLYWMTAVPAFVHAQTAAVTDNAGLIGEVTSGMSGWSANVYGVGGTVLPIIMAVMSVMVVVGLVIRLASKV